MGQTTSRKRTHTRRMSRSPARQGSLGAGRKDPFWDLVATAQRLQRPRGCPWDRAQTVQSLLPHLVEEVWEVFCAVRQRRRAHLEEELGDVLYTVVFLALVAERQGWFDLKTLLAKTQQKMIRRHPHVFGTKRARSPDEAYAHWQRVKRRERPGGASWAGVRPLLVELWDALRVRRHVPVAFQQILDALDSSGRKARWRRWLGKRA